MEAMTCEGRANSEKEARHELNAFPGMSAAGRAGVRPATLLDARSCARVHLLAHWTWTLVCVAWGVLS